MMGLFYVAHLRTSTQPLHFSKCATSSRRSSWMYTVTCLSVHIVPCASLQGIYHIQNWGGSFCKLTLLQAEAQAWLGY